MKFVKNIALFAIIFSAWTAQSEAVPVLRIDSVEGSGNGCKVDDEGKPIDWLYVVDQTSRSLHVLFYDYIVDPHVRSAYCRLKIKVAKPKGYTFAVREPHIVGQANIHQDEYAKLRTMLLMNGKTYPTQDQLKIKSGVEAWEAGGEKYPGSYAPACDAEEITMNIEMSLGVFGNDSAAKINSATFSDKSYTMKKCD